MTLINIVTGICLLLMLLGFIFVIYNLARKNREDRITYIRSYKKGKGILIYIYAIPLYWIGLVYSGQSVLNGFFGAIPKCFDLIVLKYNVDTVLALVEANFFYAITMYICFTLAALNIVLVIISLLNQYIWNFSTNFAFKHSKKDKLILFGNNAQNHNIYCSAKKFKKIIVDRISDKDTQYLYIKKYSYTTLISFGDYICDRVGECVNKNRKITAVINTGDDEKNIKLARCFITAFSQLDQDKKNKCFGNLKIFVFGDPKFETIYEDIVADGLGCISYLNKYQMIAVDFIDKYPFTKFMNQEQIDYQTSLVREGVEINAVMIGFGKTNQQIFLTSVANNQFITKGEKEIEIKKVNYHIFDKNPTENNKNLNHNYSRYKNECKDINVKEYLPLPDYPAKESFYHLDVNDIRFYDSIRAILSGSTKHVNYIIIAFGSDLENIDLAQKLVAKAKEWNVKNLNIFVKVRGEHKGQGLLEESSCHLIAQEKGIFNIENILGDSSFKMAQLRNEIYEIESAVTNTPDLKISSQEVEKIKNKAYFDWYTKKTQMERESSLFCCLSLRTKLNLMGLDYCSIDNKEEQAVSEQEYLSIYAQGDNPDTTYYNAKVDDKPIIRYTLDFANSRRKDMAIHEHLRWNSFMISKGTIPATKEQILNETIMVGENEKYTNGKNYAVRRHGNLTTFDGLIEFREMVAKRDQKKDETFEKAQERKDVIKYDYQILDDAYWLLNKAGQKIIKKR